MSDEQQTSQPTDDCRFCEVCGCCFLHFSDCSPDYCACAPYIYGDDSIEED